MEKPMSGFLNKHPMFLGVTTACAFSFLCGGVIAGYSMMEYHRKLMIDYGIAAYNPYDASFEVIEGRCVEASDFVAPETTPEG